MTLKLRDVRPQPLLGEPGPDFRWARITPEDLGEMLKSLADARRGGGHGSNISDHLCHLRGLVQVEVTDDDVKAMHEEVRHHTHGNHYILVTHLRHMKLLNIVDGIDEGFKAAAKELLEQYRTEGIYKPEQRGEPIAQLLLVSKAFGMDWRPRPDDVAYMGVALDDARKRKDGLSVGEIVDSMMELGLPILPLWSDITLIRKELETKRGEVADHVYDSLSGWRLTRLHYYLKSLLPAAGYAEAEKTVPPLKRFGA